MPALLLSWSVKAAAEAAINGEEKMFIRSLNMLIHRNVGQIDRASQRLLLPNP
jgi:hypothetical protein